MKIISNSGTRMELRGIPQGRTLIFGMVITLAIAAGAAAFAYIEWVRAKSPWGAAMPAVAVLFMLAMFLVLFLASFKRERLVLDKVTKTAEYQTWSLLIGTRKTNTYPFDRIHSVTVERTMQSSGGRRGFPTPVTKARLLITRPRRAIDMDVAQSSGHKTVEALAKEVADFLGKSLTNTGKHDD